MIKKHCLALIITMFILFTACSAASTQASSSGNSHTQIEASSASVHILAPESVAVVTNREATESTVGSSEDTVGATMKIIVDSLSDEYSIDWKQGGNFVVTLRPAPENGPAEILVTIEQQENIIKQLQEIVANYAKGEYPIKDANATDYLPYGVDWPEGLEMAIDISPDAICYSTDANQVYFAVGTYFMLDDEWVFNGAIVPNTSNNTAADYWTIHPEFNFISILDRTK